VQERARAGFNSREQIAASPRLGQVVDSFTSGLFAPDQPDRYEPLAFALQNYDSFMVTADFNSYYAAQRRIDEVWKDTRAWWRSSITNTARVAWFSSDRAIREYAEDIWLVPVSPPRRRTRSSV
jgi:glycogen phosphorylase